jgi:hypothetical protein
MIPVEVAQIFATSLDLLDHWQTLIAGLIALIAAIITVRVTLGVERRQGKRELDSLRKSLAVELRLQTITAFGVYDRLQELSGRSEGPVSATTVLNKSRMPAPIIFSANAGKIGLLEDATDVVTAYTLPEGARDAIARLTSGTLDHLASDVILSTALLFLEVCKYVRGILPRLRTGDAASDARDQALIQQINTAALKYPDLTE